MSILHTLPLLLWGQAGVTGHSPLPVAVHHPFVVAHRGNHTVLPENTLAAYRSAIECGADYVEVDLRTTRDSVLVILHNESVDRMTGFHGLIRDMDYASIRKLTIKGGAAADPAGMYIPNFREVLDLCRGRINIYLDFKEADPGTAWRMIREAGMEKHVLVYANTEAQLREWSRVAPGMPLMTSLAENVKDVAGLSDFLDRYPVAALDGSPGEYTKEMLQLLKTREVAYIPDVQSDGEGPASWQKALAESPAGMQTDHPAALVAWLKSIRGTGPEDKGGPGFKTGAGEPDLPFPQAVSDQYRLAPALKGANLRKVVVDYNGNVYVLSDKGMLYPPGEPTGGPSERSTGRLLVKDCRYRAQANKIPLDITIQDSTGYPFYLYEDQYLSNAYAGILSGPLERNAYRTLTVASDGSILFTGDKGWTLLRQGKTIRIPILPDTLLSLQARLGVFYGLGSKAVYRLDGDRFTVIHKGDSLRAMTFTEEGTRLILAVPAGYYGINLPGGDTAFGLQTRLPVPRISRLLAAGEKVWAGTDAGAFSSDGQGHGPGRYRYYASRRWLLDDSVKDMAADGKGNTYILTSDGLNRISAPAMTLSQKADYFQRTIRERKIRYGLISQVGLTVSGDLSSSELVDTDNDGLWSSFYLGSQALRYKVTGESAARRYAWETFEAFERLLSINGLKGFPSRTFERKGCRVSDRDAWRNAPDTQWEWKGTTSSDEFVGYIFAAAMMDEMAAESEAEHARVAAFIDKILTHILDHGYNLVDADGKHTLWGRWSPDYINWYPETVFDRRLGSTTIIAGLQLGYRLTGKDRYKQAAYRLMNKYGYLKNILIDCNNIKATPGIIYEGHNMSDGGWNHSDDEMAFLSYWVLSRFAFTDSLRQVYATAIQNHWEFEKPERNALWNLIAYATIGKADKPSIFWHLREYPLDLVEWDIKNSHRGDIVRMPPNLRDQYTQELLPPGEQPMHRHNANFFTLDGGSGGRRELAGDEFLLPYWMGRYLGVIGAQ